MMAVIHFRLYKLMSNLPEEVAGLESSATRIAKPRLVSIRETSSESERRRDLSLKNLSRFRQAAAFITQLNRKEDADTRVVVPL